MKTRLLVVGSGGFLARHLLRRLAADGACEVITIGRGTAPGVDGVRHYPLDCGALGRLGELIAEVSPDRIVSLAGSSGPGFAEMLHYNVEVAATVLAAAATLRKAGPVRVVLAGSAAEFGIPGSLPVSEEAGLLPCNEYGLTKAMQTQVAAYYRRVAGDRVRVSVARLFNLIGPGSPERLAFGSFVRQIARTGASGIVQTGNLESQRDFVHVADAADALVAILSLEDPAPAYVVASGRAVRLHDLLDYLIRLSGKEVRIETRTGRESGVDVPCIYGSSARLTRETGWVPVRTAEAALSEMWEREGRP
jgi:GDP-4-dehydro-6-deoxy-D-mannose reductase